MINSRVICLGELLFDCLADEMGKSVDEVTSWTSYPGGAPANVACALVKLGTPAAMVTCLGPDEAGNQLAQLLESLKVDTRGIQRHTWAPTRKVYVLRSPLGDRSFAGFGNYSPDTFADAYLQASLLPIDLFSEAEFLVIGTLALAYPESGKAMWQAIELAKKYHLKVVLDVNWRPMFWLLHPEDFIRNLLKSVDFLKLSDEEAQWLFKTTNAMEIAQLVETVSGVIVTAGGGEVNYYLGNHQGMLSPFPVQVEDTTGAGDGFLAGFIHQLCQQGIDSLQDEDRTRYMIKYACAVGGLTCTKLGAIASQPTGLEVEAFLARNNTVNI